MTAVVRTIPAATEWVQRQRAEGKSIGLVPTMGALHEGHLSLVRRARQTCGRVIASVFINPLQFGPGEDYQRYPRDFDRDLSLLEREQVDAVFHPETAEIYPSPPLISVCAGNLGETLCGASRPGHFNGVTTVVAKLFHIIPADRAFFGQKDAQQLAVIRSMVRDLNFPITIEACPTVREPDGLAMSSRNAYLSPGERSNATILYRALQRAREMIQSGTRDAPNVEAKMREMIQSAPGAELDYARVVDRDTLAGLREIDKEVLVAVAVQFGKTRLIDNMIVAP
ncbi:MAG: pantoate--beta-alanine ligase [Acidobacteria bacterium]|nr:pantoate--beta-alanine ligase [Acidobacteriota bacterium]